MANTSVVYARIDTKLKDNAETILAQLAISPSGAIQMLYSQIVLRNGIPFAVQLPDKKPVAIGSMSRAELDEELAKGIASFSTGKSYTVDDVDATLAKEFGI